MGVFYGLARRYENSGDHDSASLYGVLSVVIPVTLHGAYDYIATYSAGEWLFIGYIVLLFAGSYYLVGKTSKSDRFITPGSAGESGEHHAG